MQIYIDESGSFVSAATFGSWNVVVAVATPESARSTIEKSIKALKLSTATSFFNEVKLNGIPEGRFVSFLESLSETNRQQPTPRHRHALALDLVRWVGWVFKLVPRPAGTLPA